MKSKSTLILVLYMLTSLSIFAQSIIVTGVIVDVYDRQPLPYVAIQVEGEANINYSDFDGNYSITTTIGSVLVFSCVGYEFQKIQVDQSVLNIELKEQIPTAEEYELRGLPGFGYRYTLQQNNAITVSGTVTDSHDGEPLVGATIMVKETKNGAIADLDGNYSINAVMGDTLVFSYIGYDTQEIKVEQNIINAKMKMDETIELDIIIPYRGPRSHPIVTSPLKTIIVSGIITDSYSNAPLPNVNITSNWAIDSVVSDAKGKFSIVTVQGGTLTFSHADFDTKEIRAIEEKLDVNLDQSIKYVTINGEKFEILPPRLLDTASKSVRKKQRKLVKMLHSSL